MIIISGFLVVLVISVLKNTPEPTVLASAFGGWILAVVTFYFAGQTIDTAQKQSLQSASIAAGATESVGSLTAETKAFKDKHTNGTKGQTGVIQELMTLMEPRSPQSRKKSITEQVGKDETFGESLGGKQLDLSDLKSKLQKISDQLQKSSDDFDKDYKVIEDRISDYRSRLRNP